LRDAVVGWWLPLRAGSGVRCCCCCPLKIPCESGQLVHAQRHCLYVNVDAEQQPAVELQRTALPAKTRDAVRVVVVSDTHSQHNALGTLPAGDVFVHCGDILMSGRLWSVAGQVAQMRAFNEWLGCVPCATKVVIAGNHEQLAPVLGRQKMAALLSNAKYLENEARGVDGLRVFATPLSKGHSSNGAFQDDAFAAATVAAAELAAAPVDILITHGPSQGSITSNSTPSQLEPWAGRLKPRVHLWGHAHALHGVRIGEGIVSVCASIMDGGYRPEHLPVVVDLTPGALSQYDKEVTGGGEDGDTARTRP
jgi:predicted phosphodiesterase